MAVTQNRGLAGGVQPIGVDQRGVVRLDEFDILHSGGAQGIGDEVGGAFDVGVDQRVFVRLDEFDILHSGGAQGIGDEVGGAFDVGAVFGQGADAGNAQE